MSLSGTQRSLPPGLRLALQVRTPKHSFSCDHVACVSRSSPPDLQVRFCSRWVYRQAGLERDCCRESCWACCPACQRQRCVVGDPPWLDVRTLTDAVYAEENKTSRCRSRKNTRSACIKLKSGTTANVTAQHSPERKQAGASPRSGQACDLRFVLSHACCCSSHVPSLNLAQIFCLSTEQYPASIKARQRCAGSDVDEQKLLSAVQHTKALMSGNNPSATAEPTLPAKKPPNLHYVSYGSEKESPFLPAIRQLISNDLSEPYSIYVYRYFLYQWGHLCFMVRLMLYTFVSFIAMLIFVSRL